MEEHIRSPLFKIVAPQVEVQQEDNEDQTNPIDNIVSMMESSLLRIAKNATRKKNKHIDLF